jgi:protein translocase SecG subunit
MIDFILGGALIVLAIAISVLVMLQKSKDKQLSGAIAGGMDNFLGGAKGDKKDKLYSTLTAILSVVFGIIVIVMYVVIG